MPTDPSALVTLDQPAEHVSVLTLNRPDRLNAMSIDLVIELHDLLGEVGDDNDCYVVVLTGAGRAFCSGLDLKDYGLIPNMDGLQVGRIAQRSMRHYSRLITDLRAIPQPVIAAVNGPAYGGGMCLALGADVRFAAAGATFNATGIVNGLTSTEMGVGYLLPRAVGTANANDMLLTGRKVSAAEALGMGLVSRVFDDAELLGATIAVATGMAAFSPYGLQYTKEALMVGVETTSLQTSIEFEDRNQLLLGFTDNLPEAIRSFGAGRQPQFTDEPRRDIWAQPTGESDG
jgi:enoyl-CoA hydratase